MQTSTEEAFYFLLTKAPFIHRICFDRKTLSHIVLFSDWVSCIHINRKITGIDWSNENSISITGTRVIDNSNILKTYSTFFSKCPNIKPIRKNFKGYKHLIESDKMFLINVCNKWSYMDSHDQWTRFIELDHYYHKGDMLKAAQQIRSEGYYDKRFHLI